MPTKGQTHKARSHKELDVRTQRHLAELLKKEKAACSAGELEFLEARRMYLTSAQLAEYDIAPPEQVADEEVAEESSDGEEKIEGDEPLEDEGDEPSEDEDEEGEEGEDFADLDPNTEKPLPTPPAKNKGGRPVGSTKKK